MKHLLASVALMSVIGGTAVHAAAQTTNFGGTWTVDTVKTAAANPPVQGGRVAVPIDLSITQDTSTMVVTRMLGGTEVKQTINLNGTPRTNVVGLQNGAPIEGVSTAKWDGARLMITTQMPSGSMTMTYAMDGAGLVVTSTLPSREDGSPVTRVTHYTKAK